MKTKTAASLSFIAVVLAGCAVGPDYQPPQTSLPGAFHNAPAASKAAPDTAADAWWQGFHDPLLDRVIVRVLTENLDIEQARARIEQARAAAQAAGAALWPKGELRASNAQVSQSLLNPEALIARGSPLFERGFGESQVGGAVSWEIDLFGGQRRAREAATADLEATRAASAAVRVSVAAEAADAYLQLRAAQARLGVARQQQAVDRQLVDLLEQRFAEGVAAERELHQARAALDGVIASMPPLRAAAEGQLNRLDVLMGAAPGTWRAELEADQAMPTAPGIDAAAGPAALLRRRPDIVAAERRLAAANARIGAAISDYYPKLSLSALAGVDSIVPDKLFNGDAVQHQIGLGLRWRLFDFGRVDAEVAGARGRDAEALAAYRATVFNAAAEVETALSELANDEDRAAALARQIEQLRLARAQADEAYRGGVISLIEVLDADRQWLAASDQLALAQAGAARAAVTSFRALGGGWEAEAGTLDAAVRRPL